MKPQIFCQRLGIIHAAIDLDTLGISHLPDGRLVAFGRTIDDGRYYATIVDVVVHPDYPQRGIGRQLMQSLQTAMKGFLVTTLTAAPDVQPFYAKLCWRKMTTAMIFPRDEEQARRNCE